MGRKKTHEEFITEVYDLVGDEYTFLEIYKGSKIKIRVKHMKCKEEYFVQPDKFVQGRRCPKCAGNQSRSHEEFLFEVDKEVGKDYKVIGKYKNRRTPIDVKHLKCGFVFSPHPGSFLFGSRCPKCEGTMKKDNEEFIKEIFRLVGDEYHIIGEYKNTHTPIKMKHNICGHEFMPIPGSFIRGTRCPKCVESKGEKRVSKFLDGFFLSYTKEHRYDSCRNKRKLPFDFLVDDRILVEYDGQDHFYSVNRNGNGMKKANIGFLTKINNDKIKNQYCIDNNIPLLRIPYWKFDEIEAILSSTLVYFNFIPKDESYTEEYKEWLVDANWDHDAYIAKCPKNIKDAEKALKKAI